MTPYNTVTSTLSTQADLNNRPTLPPKPFTDPSRLAPEDAFPQSDTKIYIRPINGTADADRSNTSGRRRRDKDRGRSGSRRGKGEWKKLLWVKQPKYPDNYTDPPTFLSHLQRNPRLQPYDFWPLVADSTVIVQHLSSVAIFVCCFVSIYQEKVSPVSIVSLGSTCTILGWFLWDFWVGQTDAARIPSKLAVSTNPEHQNPDNDRPGGLAANYGQPRPSSRGSEPSGLGLTLTVDKHNGPNNDSHSEPISAPPLVSSEPSSTSLSSNGNSFHGIVQDDWPPKSALSPRNQQRLATIKSAILIYCALLGLSPILKSLTVSTSSDSIWAMSALLMCLNIFFFDYGGGVGVKFPASLSTNAAVMSSTVLASRLPSTTHVFSLTLFSIEVFGLFPVFRRHLRHISWRGHLSLTLALVLGAGCGLGLILSTSGSWQAVLLGMLLWSVGAALGMGGCSWWLIGLQRYKNVVIGPWDPARPVIRGGGWD